MVGETIDKLVIQISADVDNAIRGINKVDGAVGRMDGKVAGSSANIKTSTGKMSAAFAAVGTAAATMAAAVAAAGIALATLGTKRAAEASAGMEQYIITLSTLYRSQEEAAEQMQWILEFAKETPFEVTGLVDATVKLKAFGLEAQDVLETLGDTAAATSKPIDQVVNAFGRLSVGDTGQAVMMFRDLGVNLKNIQGLEWDARGSLVTPVEEALPLVQRYLDVEFGGLMEKQSQSLKGVVSNIQDSMSQAGLAFMGFDEATATFREGALFDTIKDSAESIKDWLEGIDFTSIGQSVESALAKVKDVAKDLTPTWENLKSIGKSFIGIFKDITKGLEGTDFSGVINSINDLTGAIAWLLRIIDESDINVYFGKAISSISNFVSEFYNNIRDKIIQGINLLIEGYNKLVPIMQKVGMDVEKVNKITFESVSATAKDELGEIEDAAETTAAGVKNNLGNIDAAIDKTKSKFDKIPDWAGKTDYIKQRLEITGAETLDELQKLQETDSARFYKGTTLEGEYQVDVEIPKTINVETPESLPVDTPESIPIEVEDIPPITVETIIPKMNVFEMVVSKIRAIDFEIPRIELPAQKTSQTTVAQMATPQINIPTPVVNVQTPTAPAESKIKPSLDAIRNEIVAVKDVIKSKPSKVDVDIDVTVRNYSQVKSIGQLIGETAARNVNNYTPR